MINIRPVYTTLLGSAMMLAASACSDDKTNIGIGSGTLDEVEVNGDFRIAGDFTIPESVIRVPEPTDFDLVITDQNGTSASWTGVSESGVPERLLPESIRSRPSMALREPKASESLVSQALLRLRSSMA